jgi:RHS repeat-associated protein
VSATAAGVTATLTYDPLGRLWQVVKGSANTRFLYDGDALVAEYDGTGALTNRYVHGSNTAADDPLIWYATGGTVKRYLHADHLGSIVAATNPSAAPSINTYDEYGVPGAGNVGRFQYTGQVWLSELGLYHYKARLYSPALGRFLQTDPVGYEGGINLYGYVGDDPINAMDPTGNAGQCDTGSRIADNSGGCMVAEGYKIDKSTNSKGRQAVQPEKPSTASKASKGAAAIGTAVAGPHIATRNERLGSNGKVYDGRTVHGNQHFKITGPSRTTEVLEKTGRGAVALGEVADVIEYRNGEMSGAHLTANTVANAIALWGGPWGEAAAAIYYGGPMLIGAANNADKGVNGDGCDKCMEP